MRLARWWLPPSLLVPPLLAATWVLHGGPWMSSDLDVYRSGADHVLHGLPLYASWSGLPFTYPPFAALVLVPLDVVPPALATILWVVVNWAAYLGFAGILLARLGLRGGRLALAVLAGLAFEPVWHTAALGQINLVLGLLVVVDTLVLPARWRGFGVGIAAGIKLTPAIFLLYFALRREWWALARAVAGFAVTMGLSAVVAPTDSWDYWTRLFYGVDRIGGVEYVNNQSLHAIVVRATHDQHPPVALDAILALLAVALAAVAARRQLRRGNDVAALVAVAIAGLLVSPISWSHHWVWLVPAVGVLVQQRRYVAAALICATAIAAPMRFLPKTLGRELQFAWWEQLVCSAYVLAGVAFLVLMLLPQPPEVTSGGARSHLWRGEKSLVAGREVTCGGKMTDAEPVEVSRQARRARRDASVASGVRRRRPPA